MFYVYILLNEKKKTYVGFSTNLKKRYHDHQDAKVITTHSWKQKTLIYYEAYLKEKTARQRELFLKSGRGREYVKSLVKKITVE